MLREPMWTQHALSVASCRGMAAEWHGGQILARWCRRTPRGPGAKMAIGRKLNADDARMARGVLAAGEDSADIRAGLRWAAR